MQRSNFHNLNLIACFMKNAFVQYPFHWYSTFIEQNSFWTAFSTARFKSSKHFQDLIFGYMVDYVLLYFTRVMKTLRPIASDIFRELEPKNCCFLRFSRLKRGLIISIFIPLNPEDLFTPRRNIFKEQYLSWKMAQILRTST